MQSNAKSVLIAQTASSESEYRTLMSELRQEQSSIASQIANLQNEVESKIENADLVGDASVMTWPLTGIITTTFHDPTYPFRHLFLSMEGSTSPFLSVRLLKRQRRAMSPGHVQVLNTVITS